MKTEHPTNPHRVALPVYSVLLIWFFTSLVLSLQGWFETGPTRLPLPLGLSVGIPIVVAVATYSLSGSFRAFAGSLDLRALVAVNVFRIVGVDFLICYAQGRLPAGFAFPAGFGDILTGLAAIPLILTMSRTSSSASARKWFVAWNLFGLSDLIIAVASGILHTGSKLGLLTGDGPTTLLMGQFPRALIPTFLVPLYMLLHLLALARRREVKSGAGSSDHPWRAAHA
ncbi:MAG TPA: hypothetical protein VGM54_02370 [Chthoniobacter sp.]|jgi:hypothetical protein